MVSKSVGVVQTLAVANANSLRDAGSSAWCSVKT